MGCVVISRNGRGEVWGFVSLQAARLHPLPQMDDVFATSADQLIRQYGRSDIDKLLRFTEGRDRSRAINAIEEWKSGRSSAVLPLDIRSLLWDKVKAASKNPPVSADSLLEIIVSDRKAREGVAIVSRSDGSEPKVKHNNGVDDMGEKREVFRMADEGVISFGTDEKGNKYSAENSPKRSDNTKGNFAKYKEGMTVKEALDSGLTRSNIRRDRRAGLIQIENPPEAPKEDKKASKEAENAASDAAASDAA